MAEKHEIEIDIGDNGEVTFRVKGAKGKACMDITKEFEEALGIVVNREKTSEFYQTEVKPETHIERRGT
jgi:hypothetical protein